MVIDEFTRECLAIEVARSFTARDVIMTLQYLLALRGAPEHLRSDNGPKFVAKGTPEAGRSTRLQSQGDPVESVTQWVVRRHTPRERERLMGFSDDFTLDPFRRGKPAADSPRCRAIGNSIVVSIVGHICERIHKAMNGVGTAGGSYDIKKGLDNGE